MPTPTDAQILEVLAQVAETEEVKTNPELPLYETQVLDSMKTVDLIVALGNEVGVQISPADLDRESWATPRLFVADVQKRALA